jgi:hypothetical protein
MPPRGSLDLVIWFFHQRSHQEEGLSFIQIVVSHQCQDFASVADDGTATTLSSSRYPGSLSNSAHRGIVARVFVTAANRAQYPHLQPIKRNPQATP